MRLPIPDELIDLSLSLGQHLKNAYHLIEMNFGWTRSRIILATGFSLIENFQKAVTPEDPENRVAIVAHLNGAYHDCSKLIHHLDHLLLEDDLPTKKKRVLKEECQAMQEGIVSILLAAGEPHPGKEVQPQD